MALIAEVSSAAVVGRWVAVAVIVAIIGLLQRRYPGFWRVLAKTGRGIGWTAVAIAVVALVAFGLSFLF